LKTFTKLQDLDFKMDHKNTTHYKHLFFDLDRTLWDFDTNNLDTFREIFDKYNLKKKGISDFDNFFTYYTQINTALWQAYRDQVITKESLNFRRFYESLLFFGIDDESLARDIGKYYIHISPLKTALYPHTLETLEKLFGKYQMHIITNGFEEVQYIKIEKSGLGKYFDKIITSERAGYKKPDSRIFEFALMEAKANARESLLIGDDPEADILGAHQAGMDQLWVRHYKDQKAIMPPTYIVENLRDILEIL
jgi:putative hydrolase of the HAD superfamily